MLKLAVKTWRRLAHPPARALAPYEVSCACGQVVRGQRQTHWQTPVCPGCGKRVFVLPHSPLPPLTTPVAPAAARPRISWQLVVPTAVVLALVLVALVVFMLAPGQRPESPSSPAALLQHWRAGREALHQGKVQLARRELTEAAGLEGRWPTVLSPTDRRQLRQAQREADLLADLLTETLMDIGQRAARLQALDPQEWQADFERRYRGRPVLLDGEVRSAGPAGYQLALALNIAGDPGRVNVSSLTLLRHLPLEQPRRLLFGVRLAAVHLDRGGVWVFEVEPDSGVLLTDPGAVRACLPGRVPEAELPRILRRQQTWATELP